MEYSLEQLQQINLYSLRNIARNIGVKAPTALTKTKLIDEIIQIQSGKKEPCVPSRVGRPAGQLVSEIQLISNANENGKIKKIKEQAKRELIGDILKEIEKKLEKLL